MFNGQFCAKTLKIWFNCSVYFKTNGAHKIESEAQVA